MNIAPISTSATRATYPPAGSNPVAQDWKALQNALGEGNIPGAQTAFTSLEKDLANSPTGSPSSDSPVGQALAHLQTALQDASVPDAQTAFSALRTAVRGMHRHHTTGGYTANSSTSSSGGTGISLTSVAAPAQGSVGTTLNVLA